MQKNYNFNNNNLYLRAPCNHIFELSKTWAKIFQKHFFKSPSCLQIKSTIIKEISDMIEIEQIIYPHRYCLDLIINQFVLVLIRFNCNRNFNLLHENLLEDEKKMKMQTKIKEKQKKKIIKNNLQQLKMKAKLSKNKKSQHQRKKNERVTRKLRVLKD